MQQPQPAPGPAAQPQQSQQPQQFQQPASHTQQWAPVIEAHDLVMDYTASMARAQAGHGVTGVIPAGTGAGYASANPAAAGPGAIQAGQPSQPAQPGFAMPTMHTLALNHVNFTLREGETVAVMGPSGSGKSTLLHALAGIIKPTAGTVIFRGADLSRMSDAERTKLRRNDFGYFGLIGSKTKRASFIRRFAQHGIARAAVDRMTCPIGVPGISGKEPEVIAVAVVAQLLQASSSGV